jgi:hypothetical protein
MILPECSSVQLLWVLEHKGTDGNQLAKKGLTGISDRVERQVIRDWMCKEHQDYWQAIPGQRHAKAFFLSSLLKGLLSF